MKFRRLTTAELKELESEFVTFLAANSVTADDWVKLKASEPEKVENLIELFSEVVFEKIVRGIQYLEYKSAKDIKTFHCLADKIIMNGLRIEGESVLDFSSDKRPELMIEELQASGAKLQLYTADKSYKPNREQELFRMMEGGALISKDGQLFKAFEGLKK